MSEDKVQVKIEADASDFQSALSSAISNLTAAIQSMQSSFTDLAAQIGGAMASAAGATNQAAQSIAAGMQDAAAQTSAAAGEAARALAEGMPTAAGKAASAVKASASGISASLKSAAQDAGSAANQMSDQMQQSAARISDAFRRMQGAAESSATSIDRMAGSMGQTLRSMLTFSASVLGLNSAFQTLQDGFRFDNQLQQAAISFETMLKSADKAQQMIASLQKMAADTPFEFPDLQDGAKRMLAFGFAAESVLPTLHAVGDAASGLGMSGKEGINRIVLALGQMQAKGKVSAEEMLQLTEAGIPAWDILAKSIGKTTGEVMKMAEKGVLPADKAIQALVAGMEERFPNMMQKQSKSFAGMMSTINDNFCAVIGDLVKPAFEELCSEVLPNVIRMIERFSQTLKTSGAAEAFKTILPSGLVEGVNMAAQAIGGAFQFIRQHVGLLTGAMVPMVAAFATYKMIALGSALATVAQGVAFALQTGSVLTATKGTAAFTLSNIAATASTVAATLATEGLAAAFKALALAMNINPMVLAITAAIAVLAGAVYIVYENWETFKGWLIDFWNGIVDFIADNIALIMLAFPRLALAIYLVYEYWDDAVQLITDIWNGFCSFVGTVAQVIVRFIESIGEVWPKFVDAANLAVTRFAEALGSLASQFIPDWVKSIWDQIVSFGEAIAAKTGQIGEAIRRNLKISKDSGSVGDFRRGEYDDDDKPPETPKLPSFGPISWDGVGVPSTTKKGSSKKEKSEYEKAKKLYDQQLRLAEYTATEKEALYKKYLENVKKSDQEAMDYRVGLYQVEKGTFEEILRGQEADLENTRTRGKITELAYTTELAEIKRKNLEAEVAFRVKAMMEADRLTEAEKLAQLDAYRAKIEATTWYKEALKEVLSAEKSLADYQRSVADKIAEYRKELALQSIADEENRLASLYEYDVISKEQLIEAQRAFEDQRYVLEKESLERSLENCAINAEEMKQAYLDYVNARDAATKEMIAKEMLLNAKSAEDLLGVLEQIEKLYAKHIDKEKDLDNELKAQQLKNIKEIKSSLTDSISQAFQDILSESTTFSKALKNIFSTTTKAILKQFTDTIAKAFTDKAFKKLLNKLEQGGDKKEAGKEKTKGIGKKAIDTTRVVAEQATQAQITAQVAKGNAERLGIEQMTGQQEVVTTQTKAQTQQAIEVAKDETITASAQVAGEASVQSIQSSITAMLEMLPLLILMSVITGLFGGGGSKTSESTGPGINLGRNPESYYKTPTLTGIPSFDVGSWRLPADTLAMVHQDELIVPAKGGLADGVRNMIANGGQSAPTINLSYSAAHYGRTNRDVREEMKQNASFLVKTLEGQYRNFNRGKK